MWDVIVRGQLKYDGTREETRFRLSAKRTSSFKSAEGRQFSRLQAADLCALAVVMLDTPCSEVVWRVLVTHSIPQIPLHFLSRASPCAITFQLESIIHILWQFELSFLCKNVAARRGYVRNTRMRLTVKCRVVRHTVDKIRQNYVNLLVIPSADKSGNKLPKHFIWGFMS